MIMADVLKIFLIVVGLLIVAIAYWLAAEALFPKVVRRAQTRYAQPVRASLLGALVGAPLIFGGIAVLSTGNPVAQATGFTILTVTGSLALVGSAGLARRIGLGLPSVRDDAQPFRPVLRGGIVLSLLFLAPFGGWFGILPLVLTSGLGAAILGLWDERRARTVAHDPVAHRPVIYPPPTEAVS